MRKKFTLELPGEQSLELGARTVIVGVVNVTPDSFSDGGQSFEPSAAIQRALEVETEGADIVEIGGESTRPGAARLPATEEIRRVIPVLRGLVGRIRIPISIDTNKSEVAAAAVAEGAAIINDVSAL